MAVEAGFLGYLCLKEAFARARGQEEEAETVAQAAARFRQDHLGSFAWLVADRLEKTGVRCLSLAATALARRTGPRRAMAATGEIPLRLCDDCSTLS